MGGTWQLWLTSAVIAALVTGLVNLPKILGEGRKSSADAAGERFDTYKQTTDAVIGELKSSCARCNAKLELLAGELRAVKDALRKTVSAVDSQDRTAVAVAVNAARELI